MLNISELADKIRAETERYRRQTEQQYPFVDHGKLMIELIKKVSELYERGGELMFYVPPEILEADPDLHRLMRDIAKLLQPNQKRREDNSSEEQR